MLFRSGETMGLKIFEKNTFRIYTHHIMQIEYEKISTLLLAVNVS